MALTFTASAKNAYLNAITGKTTTHNYSMSTCYLRISTSGGTQLFGSTGAAVTWGTPVQGTADLVTASLTPTATGIAALVDFYASSSSNQIASGTVSETGGGGNVILQSLSVTSGTPVPVDCVFKIPMNNGGTLKLNQALVNAIAQNILANVAGPSLAVGGTLTIYTGSQPETADSPIGSATPLLTFTFATAEFSSATSGATSLSASKSATGANTGTATWGRWTIGSYTMDGSAGTTGADFTLSTTDIQSGVAASLTGLTLTFP